MYQLGENGTIEAELGDLCRACMAQSENKVSIYPKSEQYGDLVSILSCIGNCEIELNEHVPKYICSICVAKLRFCHDFMQLVQRSNELIQERLKTKEIKPELILLPSVEPKLPESPKITIEKRRKRRFNLIPSHEVEQTIAELRKVSPTKLTCIKCGFLGSCMSALALHIKHQHKEIKGTWCSICNAAVENLAQHNKTHKERFKCKFCANFYFKKAPLIEHLRVHSDSKNFGCVQCERKFHSSLALKIHEKKHHIPVKKEPTPENHVCAEDSHIEKKVAKRKKSSERVLCTLCGRLLRNENALKVHMRAHTGEVRYKCKYCDKKISTRTNLKFHEMIHTGEKPYMCSYCGKSFNQNQMLTNHLKLHEGRSIICDACGKSFCSRGQLRIHMRKHTGEKPYLCKFCGKTFVQTSHLTDHLRNHSEEKPFQCRFCDKAFKHKMILKKHENIHLGIKPFQCTECPYASDKNYVLKQHIKTHRKA